MRGYATATSRSSRPRAGRATEGSGSAAGGVPRAGWMERRLEMASEGLADRGHLEGGVQCVTLTPQTAVEAGDLLRRRRRPQRSRRQGQFRLGPYGAD